MSSSEVVRETLMPHPDGSGRLVTLSLWSVLKPQYEGKRERFEGYFGTPEEREGAREAINIARMAQEPVYKVEAGDHSPSGSQVQMVPINGFSGLPAKP